MRAKIKQVVFLIIAGMLFLTALWILEQPPEDNLSLAEPSISHPKVTFIRAQADTVRSNISVFGELKPKWDVMIKAQVNGPVTYIDPDFEPGSVITENKVIMRIEDSPYQSEKRAAEVSLAEAQLQLQQAEKRTKIAERDWKRSGMESAPSDLMLFKPQLRIATSALASAKQQLKVANKNLSYTRVRSPFKGIITERLVGLGQQVVEGESLLRLIDHNNLQITVSLSETQWLELPNNWLHSQAALYSSTGKTIGTATIIRGGQHLDSETRQFQLYLNVDTQSNHSAIPGQFVHVKIPGKALNRYLRLPESALTREGIVWLIDRANKLRPYRPQNIYYVDKTVLVPAPVTTENNIQENWRVASTPLAFFLAGKQVEASETQLEK